jgi:hypothetical protein
VLDVSLQPKVLLPKVLFADSFFLEHRDRAIPPTNDYFLDGPLAVIASLGFEFADTFPLFS